MNGEGAEADRAPEQERVRCAGFGRTSNGGRDGGAVGHRGVGRRAKAAVSRETVSGTSDGVAASERCTLHGQTRSRPGRSRFAGSRNRRASPGRPGITRLRARGPRGPGSASDSPKPESSSPTSAAARGQTRRASSAGSVLVAGGRRFPPWSWRARAMQRRRACGRGPRTATPLTPHEDVERPAEPSTLRRSESPVPGSRTARTARHGATMSLGRDTIVAPRRVSQGGRHGGTRGRDGGGELEQTGELEAT